MSLHLSKYLSTSVEQSYLSDMNDDDEEEDDDDEALPIVPKAVWLWRCFWFESMLTAELRFLNWLFIVSWRGCGVCDEDDDVADSLVRLEKK